MKARCEPCVVEIGKTSTVTADAQDPDGDTWRGRRIVVGPLSDTLEALTEAESSIRDADFAAETANLTRSQILQQAGTAMLAQANALPQNVLSLLG